MVSPRRHDADRQWADLRRLLEPMYGEADLRRLLEPMYGEADTEDPA